MRHCDEYISDPTTPSALKNYLEVARAPAMNKYKLSIKLGHPQCFATYNGQKVKLVMASRLGDVGISYDLTAERGYDKRIYLDDLSDFTAAS